MPDDKTPRQRGEEEPSDQRAELAATRAAQWSAMISELFAGERFTPSAVELHEDLAEWVGDLTRNVVITGPPGIGKTAQALTVIAAAYDTGWAGSAAYVHPEEWRRVTRPPADESRLAAWAACDVLVLDDLGALRLGDWDSEILYLLADSRWRHARPTILVSNEGGMRAMLGERTASRFAEGARWVHLEADDPDDPDGSDWRRR
jgi:DNA replication protein DnaC